MEPDSSYHRLNPVASVSITDGSPNAAPPADDMRPAYSRSLNARAFVGWALHLDGSQLYSCYAQGASGRVGPPARRLGELEFHPTKPERRKTALAKLLGKAHVLAPAGLALAPP